jgi:hypothetical protein
MSDEVRKIVIQTRAPRGNDPGKIAEGGDLQSDGRTWVVTARCLKDANVWLLGNAHEHFLIVPLRSKLAHRSVYARGRTLS